MSANREELPVTDAPSEKLLVRIWETVERAGIGAFSPWQMRREGRARAEVRRLEALIDAQTRADIEDLRTGRATLNSSLLAARQEPLPLPGLAGSGGKVRREPTISSTPPGSPNELAELAQLRARVDEVERLLRLRAIHRLAEDLAEEQGERTPPDEPPTSEWIRAWQSGAEHVEEAELQNVWARLLCGEILAPGSYSRRTLEALRTLGTEEAQTFSKIASRVIAGCLLKVNAPPAPLTDLDMDGVTLEDLLALHQAGLIVGSSVMHGTTFTSRPAANGMHAVPLTTCSDLRLVLFFNAPSVLHFGEIPLTRVGKDLLRLGQFKPDEQFMRSVALAAARQAPEAMEAASLCRLVPASPKGYLTVPLAEFYRRGR